MPALMNRGIFRKLGVGFIVLGAILTVWGFYSLNSTMVACPNNGCSPADLWAIYLPYEITFWSGMVLLISGMILEVPTKPMKGRTKVVALIIAFGLVALFFLAPVSFWFTIRGGPVGYTSSAPVYRSLSCVTLGIGDLYSPESFGFSFGCFIPISLPF